MVFLWSNRHSPFLYRQSRHRDPTTVSWHFRLVDHFNLNRVDPACLFMDLAFYRYFSHSRHVPESEIKNCLYPDGRGNFLRLFLRL